MSACQRGQWDVNGGSGGGAARGDVEKWRIWKTFGDGGSFLVMFLSSSLMVYFTSVN